MNMTLGNPIATNGGMWVDDKEARAIARRRAMEEERKMRIFNAKTRVFGVDKQALEAQIMDKDLTKQLDHERDEAFADRLLTTEHRMQLLDREASRVRKELLKDQEDYRGKYQQKDQRREWDLNDPDGLKKEAPARVGDGDPRLGPSSMQKFFGEDLRNGARVRKQQSQLANWVKQQMFDKQKQTEMEQELERMENERMEELNERRAQMEEQEFASRRRMNHAVKDYNLALADARREKERIDRDEEIANNLEEIHNNIHSDLLSENPAVGQSAIHPHRVRKDHYKGMSQSQIDEIRDQQSRQLSEKQMTTLRQQQEDEQWDLVQEAVRRNLLAGERETSRRRQEFNRQLVAEQKRQAEQQRAHQDYLNKVVYTNKPSDGYFAQFGTTTR